MTPLTVSVKAAPPAVADAGLRLVMEVGGKMMVKAALLEAPLTVMLAVPAVAIRLAGTAADSCEALTKVVVSEAAPQLTVVDEVKLAPLTISVKAAPPAVADAGLRLVMDVGGKMMVKTALLEAPLTVTLIAPAVAIRLAGTSAANCEALTKVVTSEA